MCCTNSATFGSRSHVTSIHDAPVALDTNVFIFALGQDKA